MISVLSSHCRHSVQYIFSFILSPPPLFFFLRGWWERNVLSYFAPFSFYYHLVSHFFTGAVVIPASQLKQEANPTAPGLVLQFLAVFWGNASLTEFSCSPITALILPDLFCLFFFCFLFCSLLCFFALTATFLVHLC